MTETELTQAVDAAGRARSHAYAPYSRFKVGAAIVSQTSGRIYAGCNVENASYGATICAERNAVLQAVAAEGKVPFSFLVVLAEAENPVPPCGQCLQVLAEFCAPDMPVYLCGTEGVRSRYLFSELLPHPPVLPLR